MSKVVVITGASGGIGAALARQLGAKGHSLVLAARREAELKKVAAESGKGALAVVADVTRRADVVRLRDEALKAFGHIDVWVNNAGRGITRNVLELTDEDVDTIVAVNVKSALYGMQAIVPHFKERGGGQLINVSSFLGRIPLASVRSVYSAAKAALNSLTANLRMELRAQPGIKISLVMPGVVSTDFAANALGAVPGGWSGAANYRSQTADEVATLIAGLLENPVAELYTQGPQQKEMAVRYLQDPVAFEESMAAPPRNR